MGGFMGSLMGVDQKLAWVELIKKVAQPLRG